MNLELHPLYYYIHKMSYFTKLLIVILLLTTPTVSCVLASENVNSITSHEFRKTYSEKPNLNPEDYSYFPKELKRYLGLHHLKQNQSYEVHPGFSQSINGGILFVSKRQSVIVTSSAVIIDRRTFTSQNKLSPESNWIWHPLYLPIIRSESVEAIDHHGNLEWDKNTEMLRSTWCNDVGGGCTRTSYKVYLGQSTMRKIEYFKREKNQYSYETAWENGKWLIDPSE